jgi:hypothetical protein
MTTEEIKSIEEIQGTGGFRVLQFSVEDKLKRLDSVMEINKNELVAEQTIARQLAYEVLKEFFSELKLSSPLSKETRKTFE